MLSAMRWLVLSSSLCAAVAACGGDAVVKPGCTCGSNAGGNDGGAASGGNQVGGSGAGQPVGGNGAGGGSATTCGGIAGVQCPQGEVCDYPDDLCGGDDGQGVCIPIPTACTEEADPVCGCDGVIHSNPCFAHLAGTDVSNLGGCSVMQGYFECGPKQCNIAAEYCNHNVSDVASLPDSWGCVSFAPGSCGVAVPTCQCVATETAACGWTCEVGSDSGVTVHCPGG